MAYIPEDFEKKISELSSKILDDLPRYAVSSVEDRNKLLKNMVTGVAGIVEANSYGFIEIRWSIPGEKLEDIQEGQFLCPSDISKYTEEGQDINTHWVMVFDKDYPEGVENVIHNIPVSKIRGMPKLWALKGEAYCSCKDTLSELMHKANEIPVGERETPDEYISKKYEELKRYFENHGILKDITSEVYWKESHALGFPVLGRYEGKDIVLGCVTLQGMEYWDGIHPLPDNIMRQVQRVVNMASIPIINGTIAYCEKKTAIRLALTLEELERAKALIEMEKNRMQFELESAKSVQTYLLPREAPEIQGFNINGFCKPASEVGGDFFQYYPTSEDSMTVVIGDVSGKGLKAAMLVSLILGALQTLMRNDPNPAEILSSLNEIVNHEVRGKGFATCLICRISLSDGSFEFSNAGHIPPYIYEKENGAWKEWEGGSPPGFPLGLVPGFAYDPISLEMKSGDAMLLMTDGVIEAMDIKRGMYGFDGLKEFLSGQIKPDKQTAELLLDSVLKFQGDASQADDITILSIMKEAKDV